MIVRRTAFVLFVAAGLMATLSTIPAAYAGKSGHSLGHTGVPRSLGNTHGDRVVLGKGANTGGFANPSGMNNPAGSRRDRRGQPQPVVNPPPQGVRPIRGIQIRCNEHRCRPYNPFQEYPNRRAQVRDHR